MATKEEVELFLSDVRKAIENNRLEYVDTFKNRETRFALIDYNISYESVIKELTYDNYVSGPTRKYNDQAISPVWVFKSVISFYSYYIKIADCTDTENKYKLISFHIDEP